MAMVKANPNVGPQQGQLDAVKTDSKDLQPGVSDARERRIQRSGIVQAVVSNPALIGYAASLEDLQKVVFELSEACLRWVNEC